MKKIYFLLLLAVSHFITTAQYQRLFDPAKAPMEWSEPSYGFSGNLGGIEKHIYYGKDTVINGRLCKADTIINGQEYTLVYSGVQPAYYQEDTVEGKVVQYAIYSSGVPIGSRLIMHLNVSVGDTVANYLHIPFDTIVVVDSIYTINGRRHIVLKHGYYAVYTPDGQSFSSNYSLFIEGVGNTKFMHFMYKPHHDLGAIVCMRNKDSLLYMAPFTDTCWLRGLHSIQWEVQHSLFTVYPNPSIDVLWINPKTQLNFNGLYEVWDIRGKILDKGVLQSEEDKTEVNIQALSAGVYILRVYYNHKWEQFTFIKK